MEKAEERTIEVTVDKSHLVTIGERLYGESVELIRELISNAYDADATEVRVSIKEDGITVEDDGAGMDLAGLKQYFNIGSTFKREHPVTPKFSRTRIGEFGIGKFASLSACSQFEVRTKKKDFQARVVFDKEEWQKPQNTWHLPLVIEETDPRQTDGTKVTLRGVTKKFNLQEVEKRITETVPLRAPDFAVFLNGHRLSAKFIPGHRLPFLEGTEFGPVFGEIIIRPSSEAEAPEAGIACRVKGVAITKDFFGLEEWVEDIGRIHGEANADFLPVTSDRTGFLKDSPQYQAFLGAMERVVAGIKPVLEELSDYKENRRIKSTLKEVLEKVKNALVLNPDYCPEGLVPVGEKASGGGLPGYVSEGKGGSVVRDGESSSASEPSAEPKKKRKKKPAVKRLTPTAVVKRMKMGVQGVSCCVDHFGPEGPECFTEGTIIYINRDHPLYQQEAQKRDTYRLHLARLLTQEICLMKDVRNPRAAFTRQSKLLRDALIEEERKA